MSPEIINQTDEYFVISKPPGMATEPPSNQPTLRDWLIEYGYIDSSQWGQESRYGIVHRLDTDTSGILIWAKNETAQSRLRSLWQGRVVSKKYLALVSGKVAGSGVIETPLMRDNKKDRQVVAMFPNPKSRPAITNYALVANGEIDGRSVSLVEASPITGRTHQIRVHLKSIGHPIIADSLYGEKDSKQIAGLLGLNRQFLHALSINIEGKQYRADLPDDLIQALDKSAIDLDLINRL